MTILDDLDIKYFTSVHPNAIQSLAHIRARCDICGDSTKSKKKQRLYLYIKGDVTAVHCFNCGFSGSLWKYLKLYHPNEFNGYKSEKRFTSLNSLKKNKTPSINDLFPVVKAPDIDFSEVKLNKIPEKKVSPYTGLVPVYGKTLEYVVSRGVNPDNFYTPINGYVETPSGDTLHLPDYIIYPFSDKWRGFYSRSTTDRKFRTYVVDKNKDFKGISHIDLNEPYTYVFEGIFDALSTNIKSYFVMCGSSLSIDNLGIPKEKVIYVFDNDETGKNKSIEKLMEGYKVVLLPLKEKDLNEALLNGYTKEELTHILETNVVKGVLGVTKFRTKYI